MLFWGVPITGENLPGGGKPPTIDNSLPPWLPATGPGGGAPLVPTHPIVLPPPSFPMPPGVPINKPDQGLPEPPDGSPDWIIVYTPEGGWQFVRAGDLVDAIRANRPQPKTK